MLFFENDYSTGAHEKILARFVETNLKPQAGYGLDEYCTSAKEKIKAACGMPDAGVYLLTGGTQTNSIVISSLLPQGDGVVCASTGHIAAHEAGAVEYTGHKVITLPSHEGKIYVRELISCIETFNGDESSEHMVYPGMVYISYPTEYGTLYSKSELTEIYSVCKKYNIPLYIDGARLGYGLASPSADLSLPDIAKLCDVFYIGGTKVGALCGEAVVFTKNNVPRRFFSQIKQHGALCAKGRLLGIQFDELFSNGLYMQISRHAIEKAMELKRLFTDKGYRFFIDSPTNQQFIILDNKKLGQLRKNAVFSIWEKYDEAHTVVRFVTSWSTTSEEINKLAELL